MNKKNKVKNKSLNTKSYYSSQNDMRKNGLFYSKRNWYDHQGIYFYLPTIMREKNIDLDVDTNVTRTIIAFGYKRWSFDKGIYSPFKYKKHWDKEGVEDFLNWCKLKTKNKWTISDIEMILNENEGLKNLVYSVGLKKHYIRLILLKGMIEMMNNSDINDDDALIIKKSKARIASGNNNEDEISDFLDKFNDIIKANN